MDFKNRFAAWLNDGLAGEIPDNVRAFSFNLYEPAMIEGVKYGVELIGADAFDEDDPDWACEDVWEPEPRGIPIPLEFSGDTWEECLERIRDLVIQTISEDSPSVQKLQSSEAIGIGFVDGDLEIIWKPQQQDHLPTESQPRSGRL